MSNTKPEKAPPPKPEFRKTVDKAMRVLHEFSTEHPELSIGELSQRLALHKSVVSRLVSALAEWRMLERDPASQRVRIGPGAFRLGTLFSDRSNLLRIATPHMKELVAQTGHSAHLSILDGTRFLVIGTVESPNALRVIMRVGDTRPLYTTAAGKLFLAHHGAALLDDVVRETRLVARTKQTIIGRRKLEAEVAQVLEAGIAWNRGENSAGAGAVAAPLMDAADEMVAALSTVYPLSLVENEARIGEQTAACGRRISRELQRGSRP